MTVRCGDIHGMTALPVILTMLLVRIWSFGFYKACTRKLGHNVQRLSREHTPHRKRSPPLKRGFKIKRIKSGYSLTVNSPSRKMGHAKSEKRREEEREEREERRLLVRVANVSTVFFLDWSYRRTGPRSWTAN